MHMCLCHVRGKPEKGQGERERERPMHSRVSILLLICLSDQSCGNPFKHEYLIISQIGNNKRGKINDIHSHNMQNQLIEEHGVTFFKILHCGVGISSYIRNPIR